MKIRKFDGYMVECEDCCQIHAYDSDLKVRNSKTSEFIALDDWYDLPLQEALEYTLEDNGNWVSRVLPCYVFCPLCEDIYEVVKKRLYHVSELKKESLPVPVGDLVKDNKLPIYNLDHDSESSSVYGPEEEI